jgi:hypothetical protein
MRLPDMGRTPAMLSVHVARDRAIKRAIDTGDLPNIDLIHTIQRTEGYRPCFGLAEEHCQKATCRWHSQCMALLAYRPAARPMSGPRRNQRPPRPTSRDDQ